MNRSPMRVYCVLGVSLLFGACPGSPVHPPGGNYIGVQTIQFTLSPQGSRYQIGSWGIVGVMLESGPPPVTGNVNYTGSVRSGSNGYYYVQNAVVPAEWRWEYWSGPCAGHSDTDHFVQHQVREFLCTIEVSNAFSYGYLTDGTPVYTAGGDKLVVGMNETLYPNECRTAADNESQLCYQSDGNLVMYNGGGPVWASNTAGTSLGRAVLQGDGNFVVYNASSHPVWASNTSGYSGSFVVVQSDGCALMYSSDGSYIPWGTASCE